MSTPYEIIDPDPQFKRVVKYLRPSDYGTWGVATVGFPGLISLIEYINPINGSHFTRPPNTILRVSTLFGFIGGFFIVYGKSSKRFHGFTENSREVSKDRYEVKSNLSKGLPPLGIKIDTESDLNNWLQHLYFRNSKDSQYGLFFLPWFSFFHHEFHGVDLKKYYDVRPGEEKWGFTLPPLESLSKKGF